MIEPPLQLAVGLDLRRTSVLLPRLSSSTDKMPCGEADSCDGGQRERIDIQLLSSCQLASRIAGLDGTLVGVLGWEAK